MIHWDDRRTVETEFHTGVSVWRRVLRGVAQMSCYKRPDSVFGSSVYVWSVTGSHLFGSPLRRVWGVQQLPLPLPSRDPTWIVLVEFWLSCRLVWWCIMSSGRKLPPVDRAGTV